jgi:aryl-alcohol dehydrogenase-like predicted oxidoreductase
MTEHSLQRIDVRAARDGQAGARVTELVRRQAFEADLCQIALAWVLQKPVVSAPLVGATKPHHLADAVSALEVHLTDEETAELEAPYKPQTPFWW